jgi:hypothetical protein
MLVRCLFGILTAKDVVVKRRYAIFNLSVCELVSLFQTQKRSFSHIVLLLCWQLMHGLVTLFLTCLRSSTTRNFGAPVESRLFVSFLCLLQSVAVSFSSRLVLRAVLHIIVGQGVLILLSLGAQLIVPCQQGHAAN